MTAHVNRSGSWVEAQQIYVKRSGSWVEALEGWVKRSGTWTQFYANVFSFTVSSGTADLNVRTAALSAGWNGFAHLVCTINAGVYVYSTSTASYACVISGSFPNGVTLVNLGYICGRGGIGGNGSADAYPGGAAATNGGPAFYADAACAIDNQSAFCGGGGGGGGGGSASMADGKSSVFGGGGGGGGGVSGDYTYVGLGGYGGSSPGYSTGGNGTNGTPAGQGSGGAGGGGIGGAGGAGGGWGAAGGVGSYNGPGASPYRYPSANGAGGAAVVGNSYITWINAGTRYGTVS